MPTRIEDSYKLPELFVVFVLGRSRPFRYVRKADDNWDVYTWDGRWQFFDNVGNPSAMMAYNESHHVVTGDAVG